MHNLVSFNKLAKLLAFTGVALLSACSDKALYGYEEDGTHNGKPAYAVTTSVKLGSTSDYDAARESQLSAKAARICPDGFIELSKTEPTSRTSSYQYPVGGIMIHKREVFSDVVYRISCS